MRHPVITTTAIITAASTVAATSHLMSSPAGVAITLATVGASVGFVALVNLPAIPVTTSNPPAEGARTSSCLH